MNERGRKEEKEGVSSFRETKERKRRGWKRWRRQNVQRNKVHRRRSGRSDREPTGHSVGVPLWKRRRSEGILQGVDGAFHRLSSFLPSFLRSGSREEKEEEGKGKESRGVKHNPTRHVTHSILFRLKITAPSGDQLQKTLQVNKSAAASFLPSSSHRSNQFLFFSSSAFSFLDTFQNKNWRTRRRRNKNSLLKKRGWKGAEG